MNEIGIKADKATLADLGLKNVAAAYWNLTPSELIEESLLGDDNCYLADSGALVVDTLEFKGRSPKDKFVVLDEKTKDTVWWGDVNHPFEPEKFDRLYNRVCAYLGGREVYVRDSYACADPRFRLNIRVVTELPWSSLFCNHLFLRPTQEEILSFEPEWTILCVPGFLADPAIDGTRQHNFTMVNFTKKVILIGGSAYTGEMKKGIFTILNYILPQEKGVLSMHCSANIGKNGDTAVFFGLSGTGKTTLSADPNRALIGDDEHGWTDDTVFNFEGGCYAKCVDLTKEKEPQIFDAIRYGTLLENVRCYDGTRTIDFTDVSKTENTRAAYPINYIDNIVTPSVGPLPKNIFFLTADAFGVLPPISKLTTGQAMYHFISGYTAKVAGTEVGVTEPQTTFSACFGKAFLPLHPGKYADLLGKKMKEQNVNVWLINTGWTGGAYGIGERMKLKFTRAMITAALDGKLDGVEFKTLPGFNLAFPTSCPEVPAELLNPRDTWSDKEAYDKKANHLAEEFVKNFAQYADGCSAEVLDAAPKAEVHA